MWLTVISQCCIGHLSILHLHDSIVEASQEPHRWCLTSGASQVVSFGARRVCSCRFAAAHLICFASIVGQCQDLHGQGFGRHAADQLHEVSGVLQIIYTAACWHNA